MTNDGEPTEGLRARKRAATRAAIERTAIDLALDVGYDNITVEMICDACMVSQRTFFNYFGSKEGVILGPTLSMTSDADAEAFVNESGNDVVLDLVSAMAAPLIDEQHDPGLLRSRFLVITTTPELLGRQMEWMAVQENRLIELVLDRFRREGRPADSLRNEAGMVVALAFTVLRFTLQRLFAEQDDAEPRPVREALAEATALITKVVNGHRD